MIKKIPIGIDDYKKFLDENCYYVDKTLLIKDLLASPAARDVTLIPRPRRFGKTLNMSMLKYFFERTEESHANLFEDKKIWREKEREHQGQYPVIFLTLKSAKDLEWEEAYNHFKGLISTEFSRHHKVVASHLKLDEKRTFTDILNETASPSKFQHSLLFLCQVLQRAYNKKVIIIIDEYDTPIVSGVTHGYYPKVINFMLGMMTASLKTNPFLAHAFITGISRVAKESVFSDLNNLAVFGLLNSHAADKFGFTESEVKELLAYFKLSGKAIGYKDWYDGYRFGDQPNMYNPWSIFDCMDHQNVFRPYWGGTSSNNLIRELVLRSDAKLKEKLEGLLEGRSFVQKIKEGIIYPGIENDNDAIWNLLLYTGYLTFTEPQVNESGEDFCSLTIPNKEMRSVYHEVVIEAMKQIITIGDNEVLVNALITGNIQLLTKYLQKFLISSLSYFDENHQEPENSYHMLMLGLSHGILRDYKPKSNPASGYGRADLLLIPFDPKRPGIVIEFKKAEKNEKLATIADAALKQINDKKYVTELFDHGCRTVYAYGMAFSGKKVGVKMLEKNYQIID